MSLRHALLAVLTAEPMTGYDLVKYFDGTVAFVWNAPHSQIYPELRRMEEAGLLKATEVARGGRATKRVYEISDAGTAELRRWADDVRPLPPERDVARLRAAFFEWGTSYEVARRQLQEHLNHHTESLRQRQQIIEDIDAVRVPLLRRRLERRPEAEHAAILAFKRFAFEGEVARAKSEIAWAKQGLALIDELEASGASLASTDIGRPRRSRRGQRRPARSS
jgi:PadR family transcriptional regulator, regulator of vanillate utilization